MITSVDALKKWCPHGRRDWVDEFNQGPAAATYNNPNDEENRCTCISLDCMMWRWASKDTIAEGYCGLAGKPDA